MPRANANGHGELPYRFAIVPLKEMIVDAYQRPLSTFVDRIADHFDPALVGTLCVSERSATKYALIDGQTRAEGMKRVGLAVAPCIVYEGLTRAQEAALFSKFQTERRGMTSASRFKAQVIANDPSAVAIDKIVREQGYEIDTNLSNPGALRAVAALEKVYRGMYDRRYKGGEHTDPELLNDVLMILRAAWPRLPDTAKSAVMIQGLGFYLARTLDGKPRKSRSEVDVERLIERLAKITPSDLAKRADALREGRGMSGNSPAYMAEAIEAQYRKR
jgi:Family of unknown function (DUF6551)